jgi:hypothetical protein
MERKRKRSDSPASPRTPPPPPRPPSPVVPSSPLPPPPPLEPYPYCLICLDDDALHPEYSLECNHWCHLACLRTYLSSSISFCPDVACRVPITVVDGVHVEPRYARVDPVYAENLSVQLVDALVANDVLSRSVSFSSFSSTSSISSSSISSSSSSASVGSLSPSVVPLLLLFPLLQWLCLVVRERRGRLSVH